MDVTQSIERAILNMGGSGTTNPAYAASSKSLNYAKDKNTIQNAATERVTAIPYVLNYKDTVGLFGAENIFVKVQLNIQSATSAFTNVNVPENTYYPVWTFYEEGVENFYATGVFDFTLDRVTVNDYEPAKISNDLSAFNKPYVRIDLTNLKTGNKFIDNWFDVRIYTKDREEYAYDTIYLSTNDYFYLGFHARNTRRLPYNVQLEIGNEYLEYYDLTEAQRKLAA